MARRGKGFAFIVKYTNIKLVGWTPTKINTRPFIAFSSDIVAWGPACNKGAFFFKDQKMPSVSEWVNSDWLRTIATDSIANNPYPELDVQLSDLLDVIDAGNCVTVAMSAKHPPHTRAAMVAYLLKHDPVEASNHLEIGRSVGVYILWDDLDVLYVGQSLDMQSRIAAHKNKSCAMGSKPRIQYTGITAIKTNESNLMAFEALAIGLLRPILNFERSSRYEPVRSNEVTQCQE